MTQFTAQANTNNYYDSGWRADNNNTSHSVVFTHGLSATPRQMSIYFSPDGEMSNAYPLNWSWDSIMKSGNPVTIAVTPEQVRLEIFNNTPLHGVWDSKNKNSGGWSFYNSGFWRVFAWA